MTFGVVVDVFRRPSIAIFNSTTRTPTRRTAPGLPALWPGVIFQPVTPEILDPQAVIPTQYWHDLPDGRIQCDVCPRLCKLHNGQRGLCFVRANHNGAVVLTTYGHSSGYCVD